MHWPPAAHGGCHKCLMYLCVEHLLNKDTCFIAFYSRTEEYIGRNHEEEQSAEDTRPRIGCFPEAFYLSWLMKDERKLAMEKAVEEGSLSDREQQVQILKTNGKVICSRNCKSSE